MEPVMELAQRNPDHLHQKLLEVNMEKRLVRRPPTWGMVTRWVEQAKVLPPLVSY